MLPEFRFIAVLNYVHHRCSLFNKQTNSGQSYQFVVSRFSVALNQVTIIYHFITIFSLSWCFSLTLFFKCLGCFALCMFTSQKKLNEKYHCVHGMHLLFLYFVNQCILALSHPYMHGLFLFRNLFMETCF